MKRGRERGRKRETETERVEREDMFKSIYLYVYMYEIYNACVGIYCASFLYIPNALSLSLYIYAPAAWYTS